MAALRLRASDGFFGLLLLGHGLDVVGLESSQFLALSFVQALVPHDHIVELLPSDDHIVKLLEGLVLFVHHAQDEKSVALDLLDKVAVERERLKLGKLLQLLNLF